MAQFLQEKPYWAVILSKQTRWHATSFKQDFAKMIQHIET